MVQSKNYRMSQIRSRDTKFEIDFFNLLKKEGLNFYKHPSNIFGKPDIFLKKKRIVVFLDSDFWHGWKFQHGEKFKKNKKFWENKILNNIKRAKKVNKELKNKGYKVIRVWEHQIKKNPKRCVKKIKTILNS